MFVIYVIMELFEQSLNGTVKTYRIRPSQSVKFDVELFLAKVTSYVIQTLNKKESKSDSMKFQLALHVRFKKLEQDESSEATKWRYVDPFFLSNLKRYDEDSLLEDCNMLHRSMMAKYDVYVNQHSGLTLDQIVDYRLKIHHFTPLFGGGEKKNSTGSATKDKV